MLEKPSVSLSGSLSKSKTTIIRIMYDPDSDFDPENTFEKHQSLKLMTLT
jgi:hypothetical protein